MVFAAANMGWAEKVGVGPNAGGVATVQLETTRADVAATRTLQNTSGMRGSRSEFLDRVHLGTVVVNGSLVLEPTVTELRTLLPYILGAAEGGGAANYTYAVADTLPAFVTVIDRAAKVFTYAGCNVDRATFSSSAGGPLQLTLDIEGTTESIGNAGTFPTLTLNADGPLMHSEATLTLASTAVQCHDVSLTINNNLKKDRFTNTNNRVDFPCGVRQVTLRATLPYNSDTTALYDTAIAGVTSDLKWTSGGAGEGAAGKSLRFILQNVICPANKNPVVTAKNDEIVFVFEGQVYYSLPSTAEISASVDVTT